MRKEPTTHAARMTMIATTVIGPGVAWPPRLLAIAVISQYMHDLAHRPHLVDPNNTWIEPWVEAADVPLTWVPPSPPPAALSL